MNAKIYTYPLVIKEVYLDTFGHMNNAMYLSLFEEARWQLMNENDYGISKIRETNLGPTILELKVRFMKELKLRDEVVIVTQLISYEKKIAKLQQKMLRNGEECCIGEFTIALFNLKERKLVLPTPEWCKALGLDVHSN